jgi:3',5'-cyclic AMP phosphodiesterase CpdA
MRGNSLAVLIALLLAYLRVGCSFADEPLTAQPTARPADLFTVPDPDPGTPLVFIVYGDMRFTDPEETVAAAPGPRRALVARVAAEHPDALFLNGDVVWHGGQINDYRIYQQETAVWQEQHIRVYPLLGNHEFEQCSVPECLKNWWQTFPQFSGHRWYAVASGTRLRVLALDSDASLHRGSPQRKWLESEIANLPADVRFVIVALHHPPIADEGFLMVRSNERWLGGYLRSIARHGSVRFVVCASHVHNYERLEQDGIVYLVSGGGGAKPLAIRRTARDQYRGPSSPNFHFLRFALRDEHLTAEMFRLVDYDAASPDTWAVMDRFDVSEMR